MDWLKTRLEICGTKHSLCQTRAMTKLPKRTITFQKSQKGEIDVKLVENNSQQGRYIALSHCWGSSQHCVLKSETLPEYKRSISWNKLPKTFQNSIMFSTELNVYHIWIDALCIIQDDPTDWEIESAKMADIYQNSYLTLAATASSNDMGGFYAEANVTAVAEYELTAPQSLIHSQYIMVRKKLQHWTWPPSKLSKNLFPLLSRGWAFQERILSPRVLHFCMDELLWECKEESVCECGSLPELPETKKQVYVPRIESVSQSKERYFRRKTWRRAFERIKVTVLHRARDFTKGQEAPRIDRMGKAPDRLDAVENWHRIVEQYSSMKLTTQTDRLPALSGLAVRSSPVLGIYLAGLWNNSLVSDLMWRVNRLDVGIERATEYIGPSWSWASVTGPVSYWTEAENKVMQYDDDLIQCSSFSGKVRVSGANPYGGIRSGTLYIEGFLQPARLQWVYTRTGGGQQGLSARRELVPLKYGLKIFFPSRYRTEIIAGVPSTVGIPAIELPFFADYMLCEEGPQQILDNASLYLVLIHPSVCLVLKSLDVKSTTFRRIGIVKQPWALVFEYGFNWMLGSKLSTIQII